jgi:hypothetical protein
MKDSLGPRWYLPLERLLFALPKIVRPSRLWIGAKLPMTASHLPVYTEMQVAHMICHHRTRVHLKEWQREYRDPTGESG